MLDLDKYSKEIAPICAQLAVKRLDIFSSSLRDDFDPQSSDIDFFYEFNGKEDMFERFMSLNRALEELFDRKVDLLREDQIQNPYIKQQIAETPKKTLYAARCGPGFTDSRST